MPPFIPFISICESCDEGLFRCSCDAVITNQNCVAGQPGCNCATEEANRISNQKGQIYCIDCSTDAPIYHGVTEVCPARASGAAFAAGLQTPAAPQNEAPKACTCDFYEVILKEGCKCGGI